MSKPAAMVRALERAARVRWEAGAEQRRLDLVRMYTEARESEEDHREAIAALKEQAMRQHLENQVAFWTALYPFSAST